MNNQMSGTLTTPGVAAPDGQIHNSLGSFGGGRFSVPNKSSYQSDCPPMGQFSHLEQQGLQQTHSINSYHGYRQTSLEDYPSSFVDMSAGSSMCQSVTGFGLENDQLGMQRLADHHYLNQQLHFKAAPPQQCYQSSQSATQTHWEPQQPHHQHTILQHPQHYQHHQRESQYQIPLSQNQLSQNLLSQNPLSQNPLSQNPLPHSNPSNSQKQIHPVQPQIQQQLQQQRPPPPPQQQRLQQQPHPVQQPKQILQNPLHASKTGSSLSQPTYQPSPKTQQPVTAQTAGDVTKNNNKVEDKPANNGLHQDTENNVLENPGSANTKEKTPLCLINELAHFNKLYQQFVLVDEQGPAHKKTFHVKLKLAEEEYSAFGESIKKAQNAVAAIALKETKYPHTQPKQSRYSTGSKTSLTSELRTLALKRGEAVVYKTIEPHQSPYYRQPGADFRRFYNMRYHEYMQTTRDPYQHGNGGTWPHRPQHLPSNRTFYVCICVGQREFVAEGLTRQEARHNAERKTLGILKNLPVQNEVKTDPELTSEDIDANDSLKSEISLVHEIALRGNMEVNFEVTHEAGLPHMKSFITKCSVGDLVTEGSGNSKKTSKKKAAELMLEELKKLPGVCQPNIPRPRVKFPNNRKKNNKLVKSELQQQKADPNYGGDINPISRLIQLTQAKKQKDPVYTLISERGLPMREFVIQVDVEDKMCTGTGPNKKLAKRSAAEAMLQVLGCTKPDPQPVKSALKHSLSLEGNQSGDKRVKFVDSTTCKTSNTHPVPQQRVPGLLHLPSGSITSSLKSGASTSSSHPKDSRVQQSRDPYSQGQLNDLCESFNYEMKISDFSGKQKQGTEHGSQITPGREQQGTEHGSQITPGREQQGTEHGSQITPGREQQGTEHGSQITPGREQQGTEHGSQITPGREQQGTEHGSQITPGREQQSFHGSSTMRSFSRTGQDVVEARVRSVNICGDGPQVKNESTTISNASAVNISK